MNVIVYRYDSICEPDYIDALKAVGLTIIEDNTGRSEHDSMTLDERRFRGLPGSRDL